MITERNTITRYTTIYLRKTLKGKTQQKLPQYRLLVCNDQRTRSHQARDQTRSIRAKTPKTLVLLLLCLSFMKAALFRLALISC